MALCVCLVILCGLVGWWFQLFKRMIDQFDRLKRRNAFLEQYKKEKMFENGLEEFDDARATAEELLKEYKACESADYITYVSHLVHFIFANSRTQ